MPGLAERNSLILAKYLGQGKKPTKAEYLKSMEHKIPSDWSPGQSQNWWVLGVGVRFAYGDSSELPGAIKRLTLERDDIGTWGSEQHSPIYWGFHLRGRLAMLKAALAMGSINVATLKTLVNNQLTDWLKYCELALTPDGKKILHCGMRGTGMGEFSSYEQWYLYARTCLGLNPPKKSYWKKNPEQYAWLTNAWVIDTLTNLRPSPSHQPMGIRSPTHFITFGDNNKLVYTEDDQHGSTVFRGASGILLGKEVSAPANYNTHKRGLGASSFMEVTTTPKSDGVQLRVIYHGPYNNISGARPVVFDGPMPPVTRHLVWDMTGISQVNYNGTYVEEGMPPVGNEQVNYNELPNALAGGFWKRLWRAIGFLW